MSPYAATGSLPKPITLAIPSPSGSGACLPDSWKHTCTITTSLLRMRSLSVAPLWQAPGSTPHSRPARITGFGCRSQRRADDSSATGKGPYITDATRKACRTRKSNNTSRRRGTPTHISIAATPCHPFGRARTAVCRLHGACLTTGERLRDIAPEQTKTLHQTAETCCSILQTLPPAETAEYHWFLLRALLALLQAPENKARFTALFPKEWLALDLREAEEKALRMQRRLELS